MDLVMLISKKRFSFFMSVAILVAACFVLNFSSSFAASVPSIISYQGRLTDASGNLLGGSGTNYFFKFSIWTVPTVGSGSKLWPTSSPSVATSSVRQGVFNVNIGDTAAGYPDTLDYNFATQSDVYLQVEVSSDGVSFQTLGPRQRISATPFSKLSGAVSGIDQSSFGTTTPFSGAQVSIEATSTNSILLALRARASQVANLLQIQNSAGASLFTVNSFGGIFSTSTLDITGTSTLATTTTTSLRANGTLVASSTLAVTGVSTFYGALNLAADALPTTDITRSLGTNALRYLNVFTQSLYATSSVITNSTSTNIFATSGTFTNASSTNLTLSGSLFDSTNNKGALGMVLQSTGTSTLWVATSSLGISGGSGVSGGTNGYLARFLSATSLGTGLFLDNGTVAGINATSSTSTLTVQGSAGLNPFTISSSTGTILFNVLANGNIGIGTTSPLAPLHVNGSEIRLQTDNAFYSQYNTVGSRLGYLQWNSSTGKLLLQNEVNGGDLILGTTGIGNVGIGTTTPSNKLSVAGSFGVTGQILSTDTSGNFISNNVAGTGPRSIRMANSGNDVYFGSEGSTPGGFFTGSLAYASVVYGAGPFQVIVGGTARTVVLGNGNMGIGTTSPESLLTLRGNGSINPFLVASSTGVTLFNILSNGNVGIGTTTPSSTFTLRGSGSSNPFTIASSSGASLFSIFANGNVSIGTTSANSLLTVAGSADIQTDRNTVMVFEGDSLSSLAQGTLAYPNQISSVNGFFGKAFKVNVATNAETAAMMVTQYATQVQPNAPRIYDQGYFLLWAGTNDIGLNNTPAATVYADLKTLWANARADGFKVVAFTIMPSTGYTIGNGKEQLRQSLNALIVSDTSLYDYLIRPELILTNASDTAMFSDGLHPTALGATKIAQLVYNAMNRVPYFVTPASATTTSTSTLMSNMNLILNPGGGNVGIGTTSPVATLHLGVNTFSITDNPVNISIGASFSNVAGDHLKLKLYDDGINIAGFGISQNQMDYKVWGSAADHVFYQGTSELVRIKGNGIVGIGTTTANTQLTVRGSASNNPLLVASSSGLELFSVLSNGNVGINKAVPLATLDIAGNVNTSQYMSAVSGYYTNTGVGGTANGINNVLGGSTLSFRTGGVDNKMVIDANGNVGIGPTTPTDKLQVGGNITPSLDNAYGLGSSTLRFATLYTNNASTTNITASGAIYSPNYTGTSSITLSSGGVGGLTINSASGRVTIATGDFLNTSVAGVAGATAGDIWYDSTALKYKVNENGTTKVLCNTTDLGCGSAGGGVSLDPSVAQSDTTASSSIFINKTQTLGNFLQYQQAGLDKFVVSNSGALSIFTATTDTIKTTSGTSRLQDFSFTGSTFVNASSSSDMVSISSGAITLEGSIAASSPAVTTSAAMGIGGQVILRDDGKYIIIHGGGLTTVSLWNGTTTGAMSAASALTNAAGAGAIALKRPDGRYLVISGNGTAGLSTLYDPYNITASAAGPAVCGGGAATTGTNAIQRPDGTYLIMCGGLSATSIYNPTTNAIAVGPPLGTGTFGVGSQALDRDDGTFLVFKGGGTGTAIYNPNVGAGGIGTMTDVTITNAPTMALGAVAIRKQDGNYLIAPGAINSSAIYDPKGTTSSPNGTFTTQSGAGNGPSAALGEGAQVLWRQDGNFLLILGGSTVTTTNVIKPGAASGSQFVTTNAPALSSGGAGVGITSFMMPDGKYAILKGNGTAVDYYNMGYVIGGSGVGTGTQSAYYETECIDTTNIGPTSVLSWNGNAEGTLLVEERTVTSPAACSTGTYATSTKSGDLINPSSTDNRIQIRVTFQRELPQPLNQGWGIRKTSQPQYRLYVRDPSLYDVGLVNSMILHKTQFDFADSAATSGPSVINLSVDKNNSSLSLESAGLYGTTDNTQVGGGGIRNGAFTASFALTTTATSGTVVIRRPDNKFVVISGNAAVANAQLYNQDTKTFTALGTAPAAGTGLGSLSFKRPDGKFLIVIGNNTTTTSIFDPVLNTFTAGPALLGAAGDGAQAIQLPSGKILIISGNYTTTTSIYDPIQNTMIAGPLPSTVVGQGSIVIPRPDGTFFFIPGTITTTCAALNTATNIFNPYTMTFASTAAPTLTGTAAGAFAFQRKDGLWVIVRGGSTITGCAAMNGTQIYNPITNRIVTGPTLSAVAQRGAHSIPRPDGTTLVVLGGGTTATSIYREEAGAYTTDTGGSVGVFIAGPTLITASGAGSLSFQKDNGRFVTITGGVSSVVQEYDGGWIDKGFYKSEQFNMGSQLGTDSTLVWQASNYYGVSAEIKTATSQANLQTAMSRDIAKSGSLINPGASETWLQVHFNFLRKFPSYGGIYTDTWYNGGAFISMNTRKIDTPTLYEYEVTKDKDLIDLQADGLSVFRVSSSGDVFTQVGATINTSGADLAERYTSDEELEAGEVVTIDPYNNHNVKKGMYQYQPDILGVVSTDPGFVAGAYTKDSYPIALVGRVPVKVSTENGIIRAGDYLTSSSVPGHAMKASMSGMVLGKALETLDKTKLVECPESNFTVPGRMCGTIMVFMNLTEYNGVGVNIAMADKDELTRIASGLDEVANDNGLSLVNMPTEEIASSTEAFAYSSVEVGNILTFLTKLRDERASGISTRSELFTDKVHAVSEIISPKLIAEIVEARNGSFGRIDGLEIYSQSLNTKKVTTEFIESSYGGLTMQFGANGVFTLARTGQVLGVSSSTATSTLDYSTSTENMVADGYSAASSTDTNLKGINEVVVSFDYMGNAVFAGTLMANHISTGGLDVSGKAIFNGGLEVGTLGTASSTITLMSDTLFFGRPYFTSDTGGTATIKKGVKDVQIIFEREYIVNPILNASIVFTASTTNEIIEKLFTEDIRYAITKRDTKGFVIQLSKEAEEDITFNWVAIAVKDSKEFTSKSATILPTPTTMHEIESILQNDITSTTTSESSVPLVATSTPGTESANPTHPLPKDIEKDTQLYSAPVNQNTPTSEYLLQPNTILVGAQEGVSGRDESEEYLIDGNKKDVITPPVVPQTIPNEIKNPSTGVPGF